MTDITLKELADQVKLEPKVIRRMLRKKFPKMTESGKYNFSTDSALYPQIVAACDDLKAEIPKKRERKERPARDKSVSKSEINDDRGFMVLDGNVWGIALVPRNDGTGDQDVKNVWLGRVDDVLPFIEGKTKTKPMYETSEQELALRNIMDGQGAITPMPRAEKSATPQKERRARKPRLTKRG